MGSAILVDSPHFVDHPFSKGKNQRPSPLSSPRSPTPLLGRAQRRKTVLPFIPPQARSHIHVAKLGTLLSLFFSFSRTFGTECYRHCGNFPLPEYVPSIVTLRRLLSNPPQIGLLNMEGDPPINTALLNLMRRVCRPPTPSFYNPSLRPTLFYPCPRVHPLKPPFRAPGVPSGILSEMVFYTMPHVPEGRRSPSAALTSWFPSLPTSPALPLDPRLTWTPSLPPPICRPAKCLKRSHPPFPYSTLTRSAWHATFGNDKSRFPPLSPPP